MNQLPFAEAVADALARRARSVRSACNVHMLEIRRVILSNSTLARWVAGTNSAPSPYMRNLELIFYTIETTVDGDLEYRLRKSKNSFLHRNNGPARMSVLGDEEWYFYGKMHRVKGPALVRDGYLVWFLMGRKHRGDGGPAVTIMEGGAVKRREWWQNGVLHRADGPAIITRPGYTAWYFHGLLHRVGEPAIQDATAGTRLWYNYGLMYDPEDIH